ncbi:sulfotransferase domain-containing protein [Phthorimaea operculella]|nr:sulfotransferase domain-containing protein [Phthorimaea operculella]
MATELPFEIKEVTSEEDAIIRKYYKAYSKPFVRVGPHGYLMTPGFKDHAADIYNLEVRADDIWVVTFSRSGTTWMQELVWLVTNNLDFEQANKVRLTERYAFIEYPTYSSNPTSSTPAVPQKNPYRSATVHDFRDVPTLPSPRYIKSHLPFSLLPPKLLNAKVVYVARDVRDVAVSFFFMHKLFRYFDDDVEFKEFWELYKKDMVFHMPIFPHIEEAWQKRNHPNVEFIFYEDMQKDLRGVIEKVCKFFNKEYTAEQKEQLAQNLSFENMKKNNQFTTRKDDKEPEIKFFVFEHNIYLFSGKSGGWVDYFDKQMKNEADEYLENYYKTTDLRFPDVNS